GWPVGPSWPKLFHQIAERVHRVCLEVIHRGSPRRVPEAAMLPGSRPALPLRSHMRENSLVILEVVHLGPETGAGIDNPDDVSFIGELVNDVLPPQAVVLLPDEFVEFAPEGFDSPVGHA